MKYTELRVAPSRSTLQAPTDLIQIEGREETTWRSVAAVEGLDLAALFAATPALVAAVEAAENSLEYIERAHPEITGSAQRYEALQLVRAALKLVREAQS